VLWSLCGVVVPVWILWDLDIVALASRRVVNESAKTSIKSRVPLEEHTISRLKDIEFIAFVVIDSPLNVLVLQVLFLAFVFLSSPC